MENIPSPINLSFLLNPATTATSSKKTSTLLGGKTTFSFRFERQATNWGANYIFRSCADISLVTSVVEACSGRGSLQGGECRCEPGYLGDRCQYKTDCTTDLDCNGPKVGSTQL